MDDIFTLNKSHIAVRLTDRTGLPIVHNGVTITEEDITENLSASNIKVDSTKLYGTDNFIIDAKRLKCAMSLPNNNPRLKNALLGVFNDNSRIVNDSLPTKHVKSIMIDRETIKREFGVERYWGGDYLNDLEGAETYHQTWSTSLANTGMLVLKSCFDEAGRFVLNLHQSFSAMMFNFILGWGGGGYVGPTEDDSPNDHMLNNQSRGFEIGDGHRKYKFDVGAYNIIDFLARGLQIWEGLPNVSGNTNYGLYFEEYLNSIYSGFGTALANAVKARHIAMVGGDGAYSSGQSKMHYLFNPVIHLAMPATYSQKLIIRWLWLEVDTFIRNNISTYPFKFAVGDNTIQGAGHVVEIGSYTDTRFSRRPDIRLAGFLSAIVQYDWYKQVTNEFINNQMQKVSRADNSNTSYMLFHRCMESIVGTTNVRSVPGQVLIDINGYPDFSIGFIAYHRLFNSGSISGSSTITCLENASTNNRVKFGAPKTITRTLNSDGEPETPDGLEVIQINESSIPSENLFVPVKKLYYMRNTKFFNPPEIANYPDIENDQSWLEENAAVLLINQFDYNKFASTRDYDTVLFGTGFDRQNWMWFDNLGVLEIVQDYENSEVSIVPRVEIPVFDELNHSEVNEYGLYIYSDAVQNYYTKKQSPFLDVYISVYIDNMKVYHGVIDRNSISISNKQVSFEATDALGVLIENIQTLNQFVYFSQFDTENGFGNNALLHAGTTIGDFIEALIRKPFPYNIQLLNTAFELPNEPGIRNKVLNTMTTEDAFVTGIQMSKKILYVNREGNIMLAELPTLESEDFVEIDGSIISISKQLSSDYSRLSIDKLKNISGWQKITPSIASYYNSFKSKYPDKITFKIHENSSDIKLLDKILIDGVYYVVTEIDYDLRGI